MATPSGPQYGTKYTLTNADGSVGTFNDPTDPNYLGMCRFTGLDSAEVRENADDLVEADGGIHGNFWYGRRPIVGSLEYVPTSTVDRNVRQTLLQQVCNCLRADATLSWTPDGGVAQFIKVRRNQPLRRSDEGAWKTSYSIPLVAADPRIYGTTLKSVNVLAAGGGPGGFSFNLSFNLNFGPAATLGDALCTNNGNCNSVPCVIRVDGPITNPQIFNSTTNQLLALNYTLGTGQWFIIDTEARTIMLNGTINRYSALDFPNTTGWVSLTTGTNDIRLNGTGATNGVTALTVQWRDAWI